MRPMLREVLTACGRRQAVRVVVAEPDVHSAPPAGDGARTTWRAPDRWDTLPVMLRAALRGAVRMETGVRAVSTALGTVLQHRYAAEVERLMRHTTAGTEKDL